MDIVALTVVVVVVVRRVVVVVIVVVTVVVAIVVVGIVAAVVIVVSEVTILVEIEIVAPNVIELVLVVIESITWLVCFPGVSCNVTTAVVVLAEINMKERLILKYYLINLLIILLLQPSFKIFLCLDPLIKIKNKNSRIENYESFLHSEKRKINKIAWNKANIRKKTVIHNTTGHL